MTKEQFNRIMADIAIVSANADMGLKVMGKYLDDLSIPTPDSLINAGITEEDVIRIKQSGWTIRDDGYSAEV
jgi:hypothetical protein